MVNLKWEDRLVTDLGDPGEGTENPGPHFSNIWTCFSLGCPGVGLRIMSAGRADETVVTLQRVGCSKASALPLPLS